MRICLVYDCLYPCTIGGAERWYANLARRLAEDGHEVTYLTLRQWGTEGPPSLPGVSIVTAGRRMPLYTAGGRRRLLPPLLFGAGVLRHLLRRGSRYDVVHTASFPYFSVLAAAAARRRGYRIVVDWHEVWTRAYWREYLGSLGGAVGWRVQRRCLRVPQQAFCFSRLHERRLHELGVNGPVTRLAGEYDGPTDFGDPLPAEPVIVFAGRHIPEKRVTALVPAFLEARKVIPDLRMEIFGDGPDRPAVLRQVAEHGLEDTVDVPGFVPEERIDAALRRALCLVLPSRREGYGLVVVEAAARGVPTIVVAGEDNAAVELVEEGVNGFVAASADAAGLAAAMVAVDRAGPGLRRSTLEWFRSCAEPLSLRSSLDVLCRMYAQA